MLNKDIVVLSVKLFLITAITAFCLAFVNKITAPAIERNQEKTMQEAQAIVLPEANRFERADLISADDIPDGVTIKSLYIGLDDTHAVGYVVNAVCSEGYGGDISVMTGIGEDLTVRHVKVLEMSETPGLGARSQSDEFTDGYIGRKLGMTVTKSKTPGDNEVSAISGATITSKAVTKAVNASLQAVQQSVNSGVNTENITQKQEAIEQVQQETDRQLSAEPQNRQEGAE